MLVDINKFNNGEELNMQIKYILRLLSIQGKEKEKKASLLLDGFIETHKITCKY